MHFCFSVRRHSRASEGGGAGLESKVVGKVAENTRMYLSIAAKDGM